MGGNTASGIGPITLAGTLKDLPHNLFKQKSGEKWSDGEVVVPLGGKKGRWPAWSMPQPSRLHINHEQPTTNNYLKRL